MKATPLQRYALRLLFAAKRCVMIRFCEWKELKQDEAEIMMRPFGGQERIIRETVLPTREIIRPGIPGGDTASAPAVAGRTKDSGREL